MPCNMFATKLEMQLYKRLRGTGSEHFKKISKNLKKVLAKGIIPRYTIGALEGEHRNDSNKSDKELKKVLDRVEIIQYP